MANEAKGVAMNAANVAESPIRELARRRASDAIEVVLLWDEATNELAVAASDARLGTYFELAAKADQALDVFNHPYAYAPELGLQN
jgi:hypothetical protein